jgi:ribosomal protein S27AE
MTFAVMRRGEPMNKDRIENAINHIQTATDIDPWVMEIAVNALKKQIPRRVKITTSTKRCGNCGRQLSGIGNIHPERKYCVKCGQAIDWEGRSDE